MAIAERYGGNKNTRNTGITQTLLWTNSDTTASYAAQDISLDLSGYNMVCMSFLNSTSASNIVSTIFAPVGGVSSYALWITQGSNLTQRQ